MENIFAELNQLGWRTIEGGGSLSIGRIVGITADGRALVEFPGNEHRPVAARSVLRERSPSVDIAATSPFVLLFFEQGVSSSPVILGIVHDTLFPCSEDKALPDQGPAEAIVDGKRIVLDAQEEILLRCGKSSVTLRSNGKIIVKGTEIISRASGTHKIKGTTVQIN